MPRKKSMISSRVHVAEENHVKRVLLGRSLTLLYYNIAKLRIKAEVLKSRNSMDTEFK